MKIKVYILLLKKLRSATASKLFINLKVKMYSLFNNYTVSPTVSPTASPTAFPTEYTQMNDTLTPTSKTSFIISCMIFLLYLFVRGEMSKHTDLLRSINKNTNDSFEILRDILQENNADICSVREEVRSVRRSLNRSSKAKAENVAIDALVEMKND